MLSLCKFVKSVCVSAVTSSSLDTGGLSVATHSSHSTVCVDLSAYFTVLLYELLLLLFRLVFSAARVGENEVENICQSRGLFQNRFKLSKPVNSPEYCDALASTIDMCRWIFSFWLHVVTVTITVDIIDVDPVVGGLLSPLQRFAVIMLCRTLRSGRTRMM